MTLVNPVTRRRFWWLRAIAAALAVVGQLGFAGAALTLARDESSAISHVEQNGVDLHHGHNEATCVACIALSAHATVGAGVAPLAVAATPAQTPPGCVSRSATAPELHPNSCRAPPREG
ncbi:MAG TPA: hypothetical protein VFK26_13270 [Gemmatimonadaceae bacterium]|nr:hypothetical protein [Gemmatimonadaceae bacterium]